MVSKSYYVFFSWLFVVLSSVNSYKPVVIIHGLLDGSKNLEYLAWYIAKLHPGTNVTVIDMFNNVESLMPLWLQVNKVGNSMLKLMKDNPEGIHLIGYSQGGLVARGIIETFNNHNINTFVSLSSPQMGQYGVPVNFKKWVRSVVKEFAYLFFYTKEGQKFSIGNYWNDPHHQDLFLNNSVFLPYINNQEQHNQSQKYRENFIRLKKLILIGGPDDGVITPWQSSQFGFYDKDELVVDMRKQWAYKKDTFGLKTLDERKTVKIFTMAGIGHHEWHKNHTVFDRFILPFLD